MALSCDTSFRGTRLEELEKISSTMIALQNQTKDLQLKYWELDADEMRAAKITISENESAFIKCANVRDFLLGINQ